MKIWIYAAAVCAAVLGTGAPAAAAGSEEHHHSMSMSHEAMSPAMAPDTRELVHFPELLREHTLASMRDHLLTLSRIQEYLSKREFDQAGKLAEQRLGMSSLPLHGAHEVAPYMPKGMQEAGTAMHRAASRFAIATQKAAIDNNVAEALGALNEVTQACVACHAAYRLR